MKATKRRDGFMRYVLRFEVHIGFEDICAVIANHMDRNEFCLPETKSEVMVTVRRWIQTNGDPTEIDHCGILDRVNLNQIFYVRKKLAPLFPELKPEVGDPPEGYNEEIEELLATTE